MKKLTGEQIRQMYLDFFATKGHAIEPSASLVPLDDPTLLWINSGVATLKKYFDGREIPKNPRITNAQKSIRTNDIENVGKTARHHTFFEMLGNFSIGDYFKRESIEWAWEFLTSPQWIGFEPQKLSVTIHPEDEEAYDIWHNVIGIPEERIIRIEGNFWDIGEGPSGPNSEIFYDRGEETDTTSPASEMYPGGENDRFLEIWNIVFSQYNHNPDGTYTELPAKNIDTGMGLERMASVIQEVPTNFDTDLFIPIIRKTEKLSGRKYLASEATDIAFKVIADHTRTVAFAIADGALPSNEGRGYVLRRLLRRAVRYGKMLGLTEAFMYLLVDEVATIMESYYPNVKAQKEFIERVIKNEEDRFHETLQEGETILNNLISEAKSTTKIIAGTEAFKLYDTYGFPIELTEEYAEETGLTVDVDGFRLAMDQQKTRAREARKDSSSMQVQSEVLKNLTVASEFTGYQSLQETAQVNAIIKDGQLVEQLSEGDEAQIILSLTPFYAESGGQVADKGVISNDQVTLHVEHVQKSPNGQHLHTVKVISGQLTIDATVSAKVARDQRLAIIKNHTATHLLHAALKNIVGTHVNQAGSLVTAERLRFDFSHFSALTEEELQQIERQVNEKIWQAITVITEVLPIEEAKKKGANALFGEKYGDIVRVVEIDEYSLEFCGGIHVTNTSEIGLFKIVSEGGIGAGTRRIEAVTSKAAFEFLEHDTQDINKIGQLIKAKRQQITDKVVQLQNQLKEEQKEKEKLQVKLTQLEAGDILSSVVSRDDINILVTEVSATDMNHLRAMIDDFKVKIAPAIIVLAAQINGKVNFVASVDKTLTSQYQAGQIVKQAAQICGGGGGGRPDMAQAGAKDISKIKEALAEVKNILAI